MGRDSSWRHPANLKKTLIKASDTDAHAQQPFFTVAPSAVSGGSLSHLTPTEVDLNGWFLSSCATPPQNFLQTGALANEPTDR